jgi:hypothetical protein
MSLYYDELLAGNCFGQINVTTPNLDMSSSNGTKLVDKKPSSAVLEELGFSIEDLFRMARHFLKCIFE